MTDWAGTAVIVSGLIVAVWCLLRAARNRALDQVGYAGLGVVEALVLVHVGYGVSDLAGGGRPQSMVTFVGYLVAIVLIVPVGALLARLEPTRWGAVIALVASLVDAVLVVRLHQVWTGVG